MSLTAQQKRDKEARIQARKEIRDQKKKEIREEKRLNKAKDSLRQRWEENGWNLYEDSSFDIITKEQRYVFTASKEINVNNHIICIKGTLFADGKIDVVMTCYIECKHKAQNRYSPKEIRNPELGLAYEQYRRTQKMLEEKYAELNKTTDEEVERVEYIISKVENPEYRHGKHKKYHKELLRELNKTLDTTKKQVKDKTNNINNSKNTRFKKDIKKEQNGVEKS